MYLILITFLNSVNSPLICGICKKPSLIYWKKVLINNNNNDNNNNNN